MSKPNILRPEVVARIFLDREANSTFSAVKRSACTQFEMDQTHARLKELIRCARADGARNGGTKRREHLA